MNTVFGERQSRTRGAVSGAWWPHLLSGGLGARLSTDYGGSGEEDDQEKGPIYLRVHLCQKVLRYCHLRQ